MNDFMQLRARKERKSLEVKIEFKAQNWFKCFRVRNAGVAANSVSDFSDVHKLRLHTFYLTNSEAKTRVPCETLSQRKIRLVK